MVNLGKEIDRLERQAALDAELNKPVNTPLTGKPAAPSGEEKTGCAPYPGSCDPDQLRRP